MTLLFIAYHFWTLRLQVWLGTISPADYFPRLCAQLSSTNSWGIPLIAFVYLLGGAACIAHFCNGLSGSCFLWGITRTRKQTERASLAFAAFGALLFAYFAATILFFATGSTPVDWLS
jgi:hypothetical protein